MKKVIMFAVLGLLLFTFLYVEQSSKAISQNFTAHRLHHISVHLPESAEVKENNSVDGELLTYNFYFEEQKLSLSGYIQSWRISDLDKFLAISKEQSIYNFTSYSIKPIQVSNFKGLINEWSAVFEKDYISSRDYWLKADGDGNVIRVAFLTNKKNFTNEQLSYINTILASLQFDKT